MGFGLTTPGAMVGGTVIDAITGHSANQANIEQANANREFARNAHQIEVADLYKAGLNPMLSYRGSGASLGGGTLADVKPITRDTAEKAIHAVSAKANVELMQSGIEKNHADANLADANAALSRTEEQLRRRGLTGGGVEARIGLDQSTAERNRQEVEESKARMGEITARIKQIGSTINLQNAEAQLKSAQETGAKIDNQIKDKNWNAIITMARNDALLSDYKVTEAALGATAAKAAWRVAMAEAGITERQLEVLAKMVPNLAFLIAK